MGEEQALDPEIVSVLLKRWEGIRWERIRSQEKARQRYETFAEEIAAL